jgi:hypothetical protein
MLASLVNQRPRDRSSNKSTEQSNKSSYARLIIRIAIWKHNWCQEGEDRSLKTHDHAEDDH